MSSLHLFEVHTKCDDFSGVSGASNQSYEHKIRAYLLDNYDKTVRPVLGNKSVEVSFSMKISRLVKVVSKKWRSGFRLMSCSLLFCSSFHHCETLVSSSLSYSSS